jgi:hypothetical protein
MAPISGNGRPFRHVTPIPADEADFRRIVLRRAFVTGSVPDGRLGAHLTTDPGE